jgi:hypothetical protein
MFVRLPHAADWSQAVNDDPRIHAFNPMKFSLLSLLAVLWLPTPTLAQRDPPVFSSYLPSITLFNERASLDFDLLFCKAGGPIEHTEHQMYVLGYLEKDEARILELANDKMLTSKKQQGAKLLLDVLEQDKLAAILETKVAKRLTKTDEEQQLRKPGKGGHSYNYSFSLNNGSLFKTIGDLKNFKVEMESGRRHYNDKFKLLIFVPVNDCKYATKVSRELQDMYDFAHFYDSDTILLYFRPLPYRFQFTPPDEHGAVELYVD